MSDMFPDDDWGDDLNDDLDTEDFKDAQATTWYHVDALNQQYYTPFKKSKQEYHLVNSGDKMPCPADWQKFMNGEDRAEHHPYAEIGLTYTYSKEAVGECVDLPGGCYAHAEAGNNIPERLVVMPVRKDRVLDLGGKAVKDVLNDLNHFLGKKDLYKSLNLIYKRGFLLYGEPGQGKTFLIRRIINDAPKEAVVIYIGGRFPSDLMLEKINNTLKDKLKIFVFEELTENLSEHFVNKILSFLDGETSVDNSVVLATTNYPEKLPMNIVNRCSRFDEIYEFLPPGDEERKTLISYLMERPATPEEVRDSKDLSIAAVKEICLLVRVMEVSFTEAIKRQRDRTKRCEKAFAKSYNKDIGFGGK